MAGLDAVAAGEAVGVLDDQRAAEPLGVIEGGGESGPRLPW